MNCLLAEWVDFVCYAKLNIAIFSSCRDVGGVGLNFNFKVVVSVL